MEKDPIGFSQRHHPTQEDFAITQQRQRALALDAGTKGFLGFLLKNKATGFVGCAILKKLGHYFRVGTRPAPAKHQ